MPTRSVTRSSPERSLRSQWPLKAKRKESASSCALRLKRHGAAMRLLELPLSALDLAVCLLNGCGAKNYDLLPMIISFL